MTTASDPSAHPPAAEPAGAATHAGSKSHRFLWALALLFLGGIVVVAAYGIGARQLSKFLLSPRGKIFVGSPGVYTRERLVNDRYDEDYWLHKQLDLIDSDQGGFSLVARAATSAALEGEAGGTQPKPDGPPSGGTSQSPQAQVRQSFLNNYTVRSAARDLIRQQVLENLLDDRHDLTGNSVYGLKFDTTVLPDDWTGTGRAFVRISVKPVRPGFNGDKPVLVDSSGLGNYVKEFYRSSYLKISNDAGDLNHGPWDLYKRWRTNLEWRLNLHLNQVLETKCNDRGVASPILAIFDQLDNDVVSTVNSVLGIKDAAVSPADASGLASSRSIMIPRKINGRLNWPDFVSISVDSTGSQDPCMSPPKFTVDKVVDTIEFADPGPEYLLVDSVDAAGTGPHDKTQHANLSVRSQAMTDFSKKVATYWPHYNNIGLIAKFLLSEYPEAILSSPDKRKYFNVESGFFNFIDQVINQDMYAYSIFPRLDAYSTLRAEENAGRLSAPMGMNGETASFAWQHSQSAARAALETAAIGFTDAERTNSIDFGWVIDIGPEGGAVQKSQFALISVPAWTERLDISVSTGWLNSSSEEQPGKSYNFPVPIPPDFEAFDSFIAGKEINRRPMVDNELMGGAITLTACQKASIVIPGLRLWRSAMVTVGSERADRITVLPNMRGIIAEFSRLGFYPEDTDVLLRVWTSEGVDAWKNKIHIRATDLKQCGEKAPAPDKPAPVPIAAGN